MSHFDGTMHVDFVLDRQTYPGGQGSSTESDHHLRAVYADQYRKLLASDILTQDQIAPLWTALPIPSL